MDKEKLELGRKGKDKITGFEGIVTAHVDYLYGCDQYALTPAVGSDVKTLKSQWFDQGRIEITGPGVLPAEVQGPKPGGPNRECPGISG